MKTILHWPIATSINTIQHIKSRLEHMDSSFCFSAACTVETLYFPCIEAMLVWSPRSHCTECAFGEQLFGRKGQCCWVMEGQRQCHNDLFWGMAVSEGWGYHFPIQNLKSRKGNENCIHIQIKTIPQVRAQFSIIEDMYIYVCSKGNWTGMPNAVVRLSISSIWGVILLTVWCLHCIIGRSDEEYVHYKYKWYMHRVLFDASAPI